MDRVILHIDANHFYANVELLHHPELRGKPVAVGGSAEERHGIILTKDPIAKSFGVKTGEALWEARSKCPGLIILPPRYQLYMKFSKMLRNLFYEYTDKVEPFGLDEAWLDITHSPFLFNHKRKGFDIAEEIRQRVKDEIGITVSIGVSWNKIFAKFGSDYKKPDAITEITKSNYQKIVWESPVRDLLYVGRATEKKLNDRGIKTIKDLATMEVKYLKDFLGKNGEILWRFANGLDLSEVREFDPNKNDVHHVIKGIGNSITTHRDLVKEKEVRMILTMLSESVAARTRENGLKGSVVAIHVRDKSLFSFSRQIKLMSATNITDEISDAAYSLFNREMQYKPEFAIRSLGVRITNLCPDTAPQQLYLFEDEQKRMKKEKLDKTIDWLRRRYGNNSVRRANTLNDPMSELDIKKDNVVHPVSFFG